MIGKKVMMLTKYDYAGSGYRIVEAVNLTTTNFVEYVTIMPYELPKNLLRYPSLYKAQGDDCGHSMIVYKQDIIRIQNLINDCDILHFKGDFVPSPDFISGVEIPRKPTIVTVLGSFFRRGNNQVAQPLYELDDYVNNSDVRTVGSPDLNYPDFKTTAFTQVPYPTHRYKNVWEEKTKPLITHSPMTKSRKGTDILLEAQKLMGDAFHVDVIEKAPWDECIRRKSNSTIFFDQINDVGWYGNSAVEAMAMGIPTLTYLKDEAMQGSMGKVDDQAPIKNSGNTVESLCDAIEKILTSDMYKLSKETYSWCHNFHGYETVGKMWDGIYKEL